MRELCSLWVRFALSRASPVVINRIKMENKMIKNKLTEMFPVVKEHVFGK